jgi:hypothetical protein
MRLLPIPGALVLEFLVQVWGSEAAIETPDNKHKVASTHLMVRQPANSTFFFFVELQILTEPSAPAHADRISDANSGTQESKEIKYLFFLLDLTFLQL